MGQIRDIMQKNIITIEKDQTILQTARLMKENDISFVVIVENGNPVGVLSENCTDNDFERAFCRPPMKGTVII